MTVSNKNSYPFGFDLRIFRLSFVMLMELNILQVVLGIPFIIDIGSFVWGNLGGARQIEFDAAIKLRKMVNVVGIE